MEKNNNLLYDVNDKPPIKMWIILAIQHVFAMFGATILVPILVNSRVTKMLGENTEVLSIPVALVTAGIGTLIYIACTKKKSPVFLGSSFAFIAPIALGYVKGGIGGAMTGIMMVGIIYILASLLILAIGKNWINKLLPKVIIGPMIMIIGLGLASSAVNQIGIVDATPASPEIVETTVPAVNTYVGVLTSIDGKTKQVAIDYQAVEDEKNADSNLKWKGIIVALFTFLVTTLVMVKAKGFIKVIPFLIGIVAGYLASIVFGLVDFTPIAEASWFSVPHFVIPFKDYSLDWLVGLTIAPVALVTMAEHIGDHTALGSIIKKDLLHEPGLNRTLLGDGIATLVAGFLGGPANTTYGENTSVVGMTKVASVWVIGTAAIISIFLGFFGKFTALVGTIPSPVLGGVSLLLYGFIAVNGLKVLIENQINFNNNKNIIIASTMLVLGLGGAALSFSHGDYSISFSGMSLAAIVGILLNLLLPGNEENVEKENIIQKKNSQVNDDDLEERIEILEKDVNYLKKRSQE